MKSDPTVLIGLAGEFLNENVPFDAQNQESMVKVSIENSANPELDRLKRNLQAEISIDPSLSDKLINKELAIHREKLKSVPDWQKVRATSLDHLVEQIAKAGREQTVAKKLQIDLMVESGKMSQTDQMRVKGGIWLIFFELVDNDIKRFAEALALSNYIDFLNSELKELRSTRASQPNTPSNLPVIDFSSYFIKDPDKLVPFLAERYKDSKPKDLVIMLLALKDLGYINKNSLTDNQTELHRALEHTFGRIGTRAMLNRNVTRLKEAAF